MDVTRKNAEVHKKCDPEREDEEFGEWLRKLKKSAIFDVMPCVVSLFAWVIIIILLLSALPMEKRGWMRIYQWMVNIAGIGSIVGLN